MANLNQFLNKGLTADDMAHTSGYASVAGGAGAGGLSMDMRRKFLDQPRTVSAYQYSRLGRQGSAVKSRTADQKHDRAYDASSDTFSDKARTGNRQHGGMKDQSKIDSLSIERRQHFVEPSTRVHDKYS